LRLPASALSRLWWLAAALAAAALLQPAAALAKDPDGKAGEKKEQKLPEPLTREAIRELASRLTDAEVRQLLIQQLDRAAVPAKPKSDDMSGMVMAMEKESHVMRERFAALVQAAADFPDALHNAYDRFHEGREPGHLLTVSLLLALAVAVAWLGERAYLRILRAQRARLEERHDEEGFAAASARNALRLLLDLGGLAVFALVLLAIFYLLYQGHLPSRLLSLTVIGAVVLFRFVALLSRFLLEPRAPALRLLPLDDLGARRLHAGILQIAGIYLLGIACRFLLENLGASSATSIVLGAAIGSLLLVSVVATVWAMRRPVGALLRGPDASPIARMFAELWPGLATAYLLVVYASTMMATLKGEQPHARGILSVLLLVALPVVDRLLGRLLHAGFAKRAGGVPGPAADSDYEPVLRKAIHIVVAVTGLLMLAGLWGIDFMRAAEHGLGEEIAGNLFEVGMILLVAYLMWELAKTVIAHLTTREGGLPAGRTDDEGTAPVATRLGTLLPLIRGTLRVTILVVTVLGVLAALGINVLPLLAGAGVIGVAIGFGSQTLVRDIVSGAFFLADDAFRVGEYIEVGESKGTVEQIRLRSLFLRHHRGAINVLPYGEIRRLRNQSRDWVIDKMTIGITYDSDLEKARKLIKKIGQELAADPELAPKTIEPLKMQGVEQFGDFAIQIRMKMKTLPGEQFVIRRKAFAMIKKAFDENGISFAFPTVQIAGGGDAPASVAAAASQMHSPK
jgi:small-conductance mechanosensitive channel